MKTLRVDVWSDIACPWCYVGKRRLEAALERFPHRDQVEIVWRAFELDTKAPKRQPQDVSQAARLAKKYGKTLAEAEDMLASMTKTAAGDGLDFHLEKVQSGNTFDAHRVLHLATDRGLGGVVKERFLRAYMTEGEAISDHEVLARLGREAGLDEAEVRSVLASDTYAREVRADEAEAQAIGVTGVPFFAFANRYGVSGAQGPEALLQVLNKAWDELAPNPLQAQGETARGAACGPDGCV
jgi:predicted DsbA family dithiol-disulfide isomerase